MVFFYFLKEVIPQFLSTLIVFCSIIIISQLVRLSEVLIAFGLTVENVLLPFLYIIMPFMTIVIPISFLFSVMIAFSRFSADGEFFAFLSAGYSLRRAALPILMLGSFLYFIGTASAMYLEAWGRREFVQFRYRKTQSELDSMIKFKMQPGVFLEDFIGYVIYSEKISKDRTHFTNIMLAPGNDDAESDFVMMAPTAEIKGSVETGDLRMVFFNGQTFSAKKDSNQSSVMKYRRAEIDLLRVFQQQIFGADHAEDDYRSYPPEQLIAFVGKLEEDRKRFALDHTVSKAKIQKTEKTYWKAGYLLHSRMSNPFAAIAFGLFGMVLGVQDPRKGKNFGYIGTILTVIVSYVLMMGFKWLAEHGIVSSVVGAWTPHLIFLSVGVFLLYQKNRLPPSESLLSFRNLPFIQDKFQSKS